MKNQFTEWFKNPQSDCSAVCHTWFHIILFLHLCSPAQTRWIRLKRWLVNFFPRLIKDRLWWMKDEIFEVFYCRTIIVTLSIQFVSAWYNACPMWYILLAFFRITCNDNVDFPWHGTTCNSKYRTVIPHMHLEYLVEPDDRRLFRMAFVSIITNVNVLQNIGVRDQWYVQTGDLRSTHCKHWARENRLKMYNDISWMLHLTVIQLVHSIMFGLSQTRRYSIP